MKTVNVLILIIVVACLVLFNIFCLILSNSNHTGFDTYYLVYFFILLGIVSIISFVFSRKKDKVFIIISVILFSLIGIGIINVVLFEKFNIMLQYELWIQKGMPLPFK
jgi:hypothetical protein